MIHQTDTRIGESSPGGSSHVVAAPAELPSSSVLQHLMAGAQHQAAQGSLLGYSQDTITQLLSDSPAQAQRQMHGMTAPQRSETQHQQQVAAAQPALSSSQSASGFPASHSTYHDPQLHQQAHHTSNITQHGLQNQLLGITSAPPAGLGAFLHQSAGVSTFHGALSRTSLVAVHHGMPMARQLPNAQHSKREPISTSQEVGQPAHQSVTSWPHTQPLPFSGREPQLSSLQMLSSAPAPSQGPMPVATAGAAWSGAVLTGHGIVTQQIAHRPVTAAFTASSGQASSSLLGMHTSTGAEDVWRAHSTSGLIQGSQAIPAESVTRALPSSTALGPSSPARCLSELQQPQVQPLQQSFQIPWQQWQQQQQHHLQNPQLILDQQSQQQQQQQYLHARQSQQALANVSQNVASSQQQAVQQHASSPKEAIAWPSTPAQLSHSDRLSRATFQERQYISDHSLVRASVTLSNLQNKPSEAFLQSIGDSIVKALQVSSALMERA